MKILVKPIAVILLGAYSFALGQDVYPYFSDSKKQFEFEKKRIYIKEVSENEQIISGGSEFNIMRLFDDSVPLTIPAPVRTTYNYKYEFHILQNGKNLTEIEFLRLIGLNEEADKILNDFSNKIVIWENTPLVEHTVYEGDATNLVFGYICIGMGIIAFIKNANDQSRPGGVIFVLVGLFLKYIGEEKIAFVKPPKPELEQTLTNEQIQSLSESYNKRVYEEIKNVN